MISRRSALATTAAAMFPTPLLAQQPPTTSVPTTEAGFSLSDDTVPNELGHADFANAFELQESGTVVLVAQVPDIDSTFINSASTIQFSSSHEIDNYFRSKCGANFIPWFNQAVSRRSEWAGKAVKGTNTEDHFVRYWTQHLSRAPIGLFDFLSYMSVFINECNGDLANVSEGYGCKGHPGVAYLFDSFTIRGANGRVWRKKSYNLRPLNRTVGDLIKDPLFDEAHGKLPPGSGIKPTEDPVWDGTRYPQDRFSTSDNSEATGYLQQADFFKFRGRGLIQTTWRSNYIKLVPYVQNYNGDSDILQAYAEKWKGRDPDDVCTESSDADWTKIFDERSGFMLSRAIEKHARDGRYLPLKPTSFDLNGSGVGSIRLMGDRIGGTGYGLRLKARVRQICLAMS